MVIKRIKIKKSRGTWEVIQYSTALKSNMRKELFPIFEQAGIKHSIPQCSVKKLNPSITCRILIQC